jgi:hypothetical protein
MLAIDDKHGKKRESRDGRDGVQRMQAPELQHAKEQAEDDRATGTAQVLSLVPLSSSAS